MDKIIDHGFLMLAPMAEYTRYPFRALATSYNADITVTELVNVRGLYNYLCNNRDDTLLKQLIFTDEKERNVGLQLFGHEPEVFGQVIKRIEDIGFSYNFVDLNLGCPAKTVIKTGAGAALLRDLDKVEQILDAMVKYLNVPLTLKTRLGWREYVIPKMLKLSREYDIAFITIHLRYAYENYRTPAHKELIDEIISFSDVPVVANGDVSSKQDIEYYFSKGATAVAIGRFAKGNPFVFSYNFSPNPFEKLEAFRLFLQFNKRMAEKTNTNIDLNFVKRFASNLLKGFKCAARARKDLQQAKDLFEIEKIVSKILSVSVINNTERKIKKKL